MTNFKESKILPYSASQMFDLVMDIENYPQFLPWCKIAKIIEIIDDQNLKADLVINFKSFFEKYTSLVSHHKISDHEFKVKAVAIDGPFKTLITKWHIKNINDQNSQIDFFIDFSFNSIILEKMISSLFEKAAQKMINAFEDRARILYN
jgi:coenzyme Q-binding protein COQ10